MASALCCGLVSMPVVSVLRESPVVCVCVGGGVTSLRLPSNDIHSLRRHNHLFTILFPYFQIQKWRVTTSWWMAWHLPSRDVDWQGKMAFRRRLRRGCSYPNFLGVAGPVNRMDPSSDSTLDFLKLLWPDSLCEHIHRWGD